MLAAHDEPLLMIMGGRGGGAGRRGPRSPGRMRRAAAGGLAAALAAGAVASAADAPVSATDRTGDVAGLDLTRLSLQRTSDGKLRAGITLRRAFAASDLVAKSGPPGSVCVRLWTTGKAPSATAPDFLVCVEPGRGDLLEATVLRERPGDLPQRTATASVSRVSSRGLVVRFAQSAIGRPASVRFGAEATRAGCPRTSCIDTVPDAPRTLRLVLRGGR